MSVQDARRANAPRGACRCASTGSAQSPAVHSLLQVVVFKGHLEESAAEATKPLAAIITALEQVRIL